MANFVLLDKKNPENQLSANLIKERVEVLSGDNVELYENDHTLFCFSYNNETCFLKNSQRILFIVGTAVYEDCVIDATNIDYVYNCILKDGNYELLSGRFILICVDHESVNIINSLFASYPHFYMRSGTVHCSSLYLLQELFDLNLDKNAIIERAIYHCNYNKTILQDVKRSSIATHYEINNSNFSSKSYLQNVIVLKKDISKAKAIELLTKRMGLLCKIYSSKYNKLSISLSGGRDSRFLLCVLMNEINKENIGIYTVGNKNDVEFRVGKKFTEHFSLNHYLFSPPPLNEFELNDYTKKIENINFPVQYKNSFIKFLQNTKPNVINTAIPETLLCHLGYFKGDAHPVINFINKRHSGISGNSFINGKDVESQCTTDAQLYWKELSDNLPNETSTKIFFELTTFQRDWVYKILRAFDYAGNTICVMEDPEVLSILSSVPQLWLEDDKFYDEIIQEKYPELYRTPTTRQFQLKNILKNISLSNPKDIFLYCKSIFYNASLGYLTKRNYAFMANYITTNSHFIEGLYNKDSLLLLLDRLQKHGYSNNRVLNFFKRKFYQKSYINEYELVTPMCIISIIKNFSSFVKKDSNMDM